MSRNSFFSSAVVVSALMSPCVLLAQQSDLAISPFVSFLPAAGSNPLAGLALTLAGDAGFGLRASAHLVLDNSIAFGSNASIRPWGADADARERERP